MITSKIDRNLKNNSIEKIEQISKELNLKPTSSAITNKIKYD